MTTTSLEIEGVLVFQPVVFTDDRGYFMETQRIDLLQSVGVSTTFVQENQSGSQGGTLRGLHYQLRRPQAKLCRVLSGEVLDVVVDIRLNSPTFGKSASVVLSEENKKQIYIPRGFAHGFVVLSSFAEFLYKCDDYYDPGDQHGIAWNDPTLGIDWVFGGSPLLSVKDSNNPLLCEVEESGLPVFELEWTSK